MLIIAHRMRELNFAQLMCVYEQSNRQNGQEFYPNYPENEQILLAEQDFRAYLSREFYRDSRALYAVWAPEGIYKAALRLEPYRDGLLLEALETAPEHRRKGYAKLLICAVLEKLAESNETVIYAHVDKKNEYSLSAHTACGFQIILDYAAYIDGSVSHKAFTLCYNLK